MSLTTQLLSLARCRTQADRIRVLQCAASDKRFNIDQQTELRTLLDEARRAPDPRVRALRPILNPGDICKHLIPLRSGPKPVLTAKQGATVDEWVDGWMEAERLHDKGVPPPGPFLLCGPTGSGKSVLTNYLAERLTGIRSGVVIEAHKMVESHMGQTSANLDKAFEAANLNSGLIVIEEMDALAESRVDTGSGADRENNRITVSLMRLIEASPAAIVATTNRPNSLDAALLRRFEYRLDLPLADEAMRRMVVARHFDGKAPDALVALPLTQSIPLVARIKRLVVMRSLSLDQATEAALAA